MKMKTKKIVGIMLFVFIISAIFPNGKTTFEQGDLNEIDLTEIPEAATTTKPRSKYVVVPLTINQVEGTNMTKAEIEERIKKMNEIYNCEVVIFVWNGTINTIPDPEGNGDGEIDYNRSTRTKVRNEAAKKSGGKGVSITVTNSLGNNNTNGMCLVGGPHSAIVRKDTDGTTWAHEVQHGLGQSHGPSQPAGEDLDGDGDKTNDRGWDIDGDGNVTKKDQGYNLWGRRSDRTGNNMSTAGHNAIFGNVSALTGVRVKTRPAKPATTKHEGITPLIGGITPGMRNESIMPDKTHLNIISGGFNVNYSLPMMNVWIQIADMPMMIAGYNMTIECDPTFGDPFDGADFRIEFWCNSGAFELITHVWTGEDWMSFAPEPFNPLLGEDTINFDNETGSGMVDSFFDVFIEVEIPHPIVTDALRVSEETTFWFESFGDDFQQVDRTENTTVNLLEMPVETITVSNELTASGGYLTVNGTNFTPSSEATLYFDGEFIGTVTTDEQGYFTHDILVIRELSKDNVILTAMDSNGKGDGIYIDIEGSGPTTTDTSMTTDTSTTTDTETITTTSPTTTNGGDGDGDSDFDIPGFPLIWVLGISGIFVLALIKKRRNHL